MPLITGRLTESTSNAAASAATHFAAISRTRAAPTCVFACTRNLKVLRRCEMLPFECLPCRVYRTASSLSLVCTDSHFAVCGKRRHCQLGNFCYGYF